MKVRPVLALCVTLLSATCLFAEGVPSLFGGPLLRPEAEAKFVRPLTAPYFHEDAFITTDLRAWHLRHHFRSDTIAAAASDVDVTALQLRIALSPRFQLVAYKDGYTRFAGPLPGAEEDEGWNDLAAGLKWAFYQNPDRNLHAAVGAGVELGIGERDVLQDTNEYRLWGSLNRGLGRLHLGANLNLRFADDQSEGLLGASDMLSVHLHADYHLHPRVSPVVEINYYHVLDAGAPGLPFSGVDAGSLGGGEDEDTLTGALGIEIRPLPQMGIRAAYENLLNDNVSLFGHRWTFSVTWEF